MSVLINPAQENVYKKNRLAKRKEEQRVGKKNKKGIKQRAILENLEQEEVKEQSNQKKKF